MIHTEFVRTTGDVDPRQTIGAVFGIGEDGGKYHLGTGSIIGDGTVVLTAEHVIRDFTGLLTFAAIPIPGRVAEFPLTVIEADHDRDLAVLRLDGYRTDPLPIAWGVNVSYNTDLLTLEYAQTEQTDAGAFVLNPAARRGHKTRNVNAAKLGRIAG